MTGGVGTVIGAIAGGLIMGVLNNGISLMGVGTDYQQFIKGKPKPPPTEPLQDESHTLATADARRSQT